MKTAARNRKHGGPYFGERKCFDVTLERVQKGFLSERKGKVILCKWTENRKGAGTNSGESGARNLEAESIRSRAESTGGCVKLKTVTEIVWSSAHDTFPAIDGRIQGRLLQSMPLRQGWLNQVNQVHGMLHTKR